MTGTPHRKLTRPGRNRIGSSLVSILAAGPLLAGCGGSGDDPGKPSLNLESFTSPRGNIGCFADGSTVRRENVRTGHGFALSPDAYRLF